MESLPFLHEVCWGHRVEYSMTAASWRYRHHVDGQLHWYWTTDQWSSMQVHWPRHTACHHTATTICTTSDKCNIIWTLVNVRWCENIKLFLSALQHCWFRLSNKEATKPVKTFSGFLFQGTRANLEQRHNKKNRKNKNWKWKWKYQVKIYAFTSALDITTHLFWCITITKCS